MKTVDVCHHQRWKVRVGTLGGDYRRCLDCGLEEQMSLDDVKVRFADAQDEWYGASDPACLSPFALALSASDAAYRLRILQRAVPAGRLLEVGPGSGQFAAAAMAAGYEVVAIEDSAVLAEAVRARGVTVHQGTFESLNLAPESFDIVVNWHVIEHVFDPVGFLFQTARVSKPGGVIVLGTPNAASFEHRLSGKHSPNYSRAHLRLFTTENLVDLLSQSGWESVETFTTDEPEHWLKVGAALVRNLLGRQAKASLSTSHTVEAQPLAVQSINAALGMAIVRVAGAISWLPRRLQAKLGRGNEVVAIARRRSPE